MNWVCDYMSQILLESNMKIGPFEDNLFFKIENSKLHKSMKSKFRATECIIKRSDNILLIEAKTSCPNVDVSKSDTEEIKIKKCNEYFIEIKEKFEDTFNMYLAVYVGKNMNYDEIGTDLLLDGILKASKIKLVLIIKNANRDWLPQIKAMLEKELIKFCRLWKVDIVVLNEEMAIDRRLCVR